ncbi:MAG: chromatin protein Cren7 [Sulfolobales archaeon]|nr:chromatin protein Cren7 [Sulfolobales archaeon]MCX8185591.1 chromatin protein Cren7 [Sulfolobales archaeon]MDW7969534.1 chromatin protein Cren7 [Sulfolobales archaeon]
MVKCPKCNSEIKPEKTWQLISPLPDSEGRITITIMGSFNCSNCGYRWRGVVSKIKTGGDDVEVEGGASKKVLKGSKPEKERRVGQIIEVDLSDLEEE